MNRRYQASDLNNFYQMPMYLFKGRYHKELGNDAKVLYSLLKSRHELSIRNGWIDENDCVYLIYTRVEMAAMLNITQPTLRKALDQLKQCDLIEEEQIGLNRANRIYLLKPSADYLKELEKKSETVEAAEVVEDVEEEEKPEEFTLDDEPEDKNPETDQEQNKEEQNPEESAKNPVNTRSEKIFHSGENAGNAENTRSEKNLHSGVKKNFTQECKNLSPRYIDNRYIDNKYIYLSHHITSHPISHEDFKKQIDYDGIRSDGNVNITLVDDLVKIATDVLNATADQIRIAGENKTALDVKNVYSQLGREHIIYVCKGLTSTLKQVKNPTAYLRTALYNSVTDINTNRQVQKNVEDSATMESHRNIYDETKFLYNSGKRAATETERK